MTEYPDAGRDRDRFVGSAPGPVLTAEGAVAAGSTVAPDLAGEPPSIRPESQPGERPEERGAYGEQRAAQRADGQQKQWSGRLGEMSYELRQMAASRADPPARSLVTQPADRSSMLAGYLSERRLQELLGEVRDFARRKPGTFLVAMAAAGFIAGRLGRSVSPARGEGDGG